MRKNKATKFYGRLFDKMRFAIQAGNNDFFKRLYKIAKRTPFREHTRVVFGKLYQQTKR